MVVTEGTVMRRLRALEPSQESVETIALWVLHHHQEHATIAHCWLAAFAEAAGDKCRLALVYLLNDVCQKARRKKLEHLRNAFIQPFADAANIIKHNAKLVGEVDRVLNILVERDIFSPSTVAKIRTGFRSRSKSKGRPAEGEQAESSNHSAVTPMDNGDNDESIDFDDALIADFSPDMLITELERHKQSEVMIQKARELLTTDAFSIKVKSALKDREQGKSVLGDMSRAIKRMSDFIGALESHVSQHESMVSSVHKGVAYFGAQLRDATVVEEAYRSFGAGISHVKDSLAEIDRTGVYPAASPPRDAPSPEKDNDPFEAGVENLIQEMKKPGAVDSFQEADMELDDDYLHSLEANDSFMCNPAMVRRAAAAATATATSSGSSVIKVDPRLSRLANANGPNSAVPMRTGAHAQAQQSASAPGSAFANAAPVDSRYALPPPALFDPNRPPPAIQSSQISPSALSPQSMSGAPPVYGRPPPPVQMADGVARPPPASSVSPPPQQQAKLGYMHTSNVYDAPQASSAVQLGPQPQPPHQAQLRMNAPRQTYGQQQQQQRGYGQWQ